MRIALEITIAIVFLLCSILLFKKTNLGFSNKRTNEQIKVYSYRYKISCILMFLSFIAIILLLIGDLLDFKFIYIIGLGLLCFYPIFLFIYLNLKKS